MSQAAIKFCLARPAIVSVLPNFTNLEELREYTGAVDAPDLTKEEQASLDELWENNFNAEPAPQFREV
jgi:aryl-alcohol dehydrogenase-like predicted oxidoreductase